MSVMLRVAHVIRSTSVVISARYCWKPAKYEQGQYDGKIREYFYYLDHNGQLFLHDARMKNFTSCYKEKKFLAFFFKQLQNNKSKRYVDDFPYVSHCGRERNYLQVDDTPIVYTNFIVEGGVEKLTYCGAQELLTVPFEPTSLCMLPNGRVYHTAPAKYGNFGLLRSPFANELSQYFVYRDGAQAERDSPTHFIRNGIEHRLNNALLTEIKSRDQARNQEHET